MKYLYKYPQTEFPYRPVDKPGAPEEFEYELIDTGIFDDDRYFDRLRRIRQSRSGRHPDPDHRPQPRARTARLHLLPTLWFRNTWSLKAGHPKPSLRASDGAIRASHPELGEYTLSCDGAPGAPLYRQREQPPASLRPANAFSLGEGRLPPVRHRRETPAPSTRRQTGTKAAARYILDVPAGGSTSSACAYLLLRRTRA